MPRTIEISASPETAEAFLGRVGRLDGVVGSARARGVSLDPPGDVVTLRVTNDGTRAVFDVMADLALVDRGATVVTSEPRALIARAHQERIDGEPNETVWDEIAFFLRQDTTIDVNYLSSMTLAGALAAVGLLTDSLYLIIGSMLVAPGFEPLVRIPFGLVAGPRESTRRGLVSTVSGYGVLMLGGLITALVMRHVVFAGEVLPGTGSWIGVWSTITRDGIFSSLLGATAGIVVIAAQRPVLTTGVMIALALIPSMAIVGIALSSGDLVLAGAAFARWLVDAMLVVIVSGLLLGVKRVTIHRRPALS